LILQALKTLVIIRPRHWAKVGFLLQHFRDLCDALFINILMPPGAVRQPCLPETAEAAWYNSEHESQGKLLGNPSNCKL